MSMTRTGERILIGATIVALLVALVIPLTALAGNGPELQSAPALDAGSVPVTRVQDKVITK